MHCMTKKEEIEEIKRLGLLTNKLREHIIGYSEIHELRTLLSELSKKMTLAKFDSLMADLGYNTIDELLNKISAYNSLDFANQMKISNFIGSISGTTMSIQKDVIVKYKNQKNGKL